MTSCPTCLSEFDPAVTGGTCPRCSLAGALTLSSADQNDDFELLSELGHGGMGVVSLARQRSLNRLVALKVIARGDAHAEARLLREARAAAAIQHPHVIAVHDLGQSPAGAFIAMEYCEGGDLRERLRRAPLSPRAAAELGVKLADAIRHAHAAGILHRDLKPSNVLLTTLGEPKLGDFGLSASLAGMTGEFTRTGEIAGSPSYLAPEALTSGHVPGAAVDIYGLGAVLYECVTGRAPFTGDSAAGVLVQITTTEPVPPQLLNPAVPADLNTVILKCLEKQPAARYDSAAALRDDLQAFLDGRPITARPVSTAGRLLRWSRRNPALAIAVAVIFAGTIASALLLAERNQRLGAALVRSETSEAAARSALRDSLLAQARAVRQSGRQGQRHEALRLVRESLAAGGASTAARTEALAALALEDWIWTGTALTFPQARNEQKFGFDAALEHVAAPSTQGGPAAVDIVRLSDQSRQRTLTAPFELPLIETFFGATPGWIAATYADRSQAVWGPGDTSPRWTHQPGVRYCGIELSPLGDGWWFTTKDNVVRWHDAVTGAETDWSSTNSWVYAIGVSPNGRHLAIVRDDRLELWDVAARKKLWESAADVGVTRPAWTPDGLYVICDRYEGAPEVVLWSVESGAASIVLRGQEFRSRALAMHPDGRRLFSLDDSSTLHLWDIFAGRELLRGPAGPHGLGLSADGERIMLSSGYQQMRRLSLAPMQLFQPLKGFYLQLAEWQSVAAGPDGSWLVLAKPNRIRFLDDATGTVLGNHPTPATYARVLAFPDARRLVYSSARVGIRAVDATVENRRVALANDRELAAPANHQLLAMSLQGRWWLTARSTDGVCELWPDGDAGRAIPLGPGKTGSVSPDGRWAAVIATDGGRTTLHRLPGGEVLATIPGTGVDEAAFSRDGAWLAILDNSGYRLFTPAQPGQARWQFSTDTPNPDYLRCAFSPDSGHLAYQSGPGKIGFFNLRESRPELVLDLPEGTIPSQLLWSNDSQRLFLFSHYNEMAMARPAAANALLAEAGIGP